MKITVVYGTPIKIQERGLTKVIRVRKVKKIEVK